MSRSTAAVINYEMLSKYFLYFDNLMHYLIFHPSILLYQSHSIQYSVSQSEASSAASLSKLEQSVNSEMLKWGMEQLESMTMSKEPKSEVTALIYRSLTASQGKVWELNK